MTQDIYTLWRYGQKVSEGTASELAEIVGRRAATIVSRSRTGEPFENGMLVTFARTQEEEPKKAEKPEELKKPKPKRNLMPTERAQTRPKAYRLFRDDQEVDRGTAEDLSEWYEEEAYTIRLAAQNGTLFLDTYRVVPTDQQYIPEGQAPDPVVVRAAPVSYTSWRDRHPGVRVPVTPGGRSGRARAL